MRFSPRALSASLLSLLLVGTVVAACSDQDGGMVLPPPTEPVEPPPALTQVRCDVDVRQRSMRCGDPLGTEANLGKLVLGGQGELVNLASTNIAVSPFGTDSLSFTFDVTVENLIRMPFATQDTGSFSPDAEGVRVFFLSGPNVTGGTGEIGIGNPDGTGIFTVSGQEYFEYDDVNRSGISPMPLFRNEVTMPKNWQLLMDNTVTNFAFTVAVSSQVPFWSNVPPFYKGFTDVVPDSSAWRVVREDTVTVETADSVQLEGAVRTRLGRLETGSWPITYQSSDLGVATVDLDGTVIGVAEGSALVSGFASQHPSYRRTRVLVNDKPMVQPDSAWAMENLRREVPAPGVLANDTSRTVGESVTAVPDTVTSTLGAEVRINADGSFEYLPLAGVAGVDEFTYQATDGFYTGSAQVTVVVAESHVWFVHPDSAGDGTDFAPFGTLSAAVAAAAAGDSILLLENGTTLDDVVTLGAGMSVIGAGTTEAVTRTLQDPGATVLTLLPGGEAAPAVNSAGNTFTLSTNNLLRGFTINNSAGTGAGITGSSFGTLTVADLSVNTTGPALALTGGALSGTFDLVTSTGSSSNGVALTTVTGTPTVLSGNLSGAAGAALLVSGGSVSFAYGGGITQGNAASLVSIAGGHTGSLTFNGTLQATAGDGLQFSDADGVYTFNGTTTLNGGDAGVDILAGSDGVFTFAATTAITSPTGAAFRVNGSTPTVTYSGSISQGTAAVALVDITNMSADSVRFLAGSNLQATNGTGVQLVNADGVARFLGTTTLNGGDAGVDVTAGADGTIEFSAGASISNGVGDGLSVFESAPSLTFAGSISTGAGRPVAVDGASPCGTISVSGSIFTNGTGILVQDCSAGTIALTGTKTLNTGAAPGVTLTNNAVGTAINLGGGALNITTSNVGILGNGAAGFGTLTVASGTVASTSAAALNLTNGSLNATFTSLSTPLSATNSVSLTTVSGTLNVNGGTLSGALGTTFNVSGGTVGGTIAANISQANAASLITVAGGHTTGTLNFTGDVAATNGNGVQLTDADGTYNFTGDFNLNGAGDEGIDMGAGTTGSVTVNPSLGNAASIVSPSGIAIDIAGGSLSFRGDVTQASNAALLNVNGGAGGHTGTVAFPAGTLNASNGSGLQFNNADGTYDFDGTVTLNGGDAGIDVTNGSDGTFTFPTATAITNPVGTAITIQNSVSPFSFTYSGGLTKNNNSVTALLIQNNTGGTVTFDGDATASDGDPADVTRTFSTGTATAVNLLTNSGATINFSGGGLAISTTSGAGFNATGGGTVSVTGAGNTVNATGGGTAVNIQNTTIGGSGVSFYRVDAIGGGTNGIVVQNTGSGGFQVTGDGASDLANTTRGRTTARSGGGVIALGSGGNITGKVGDGVNLTTTGAVTLRNMVITNGSADGIDATSVTGGLILDNLQVTGHANNRGVGVTTASGLRVFHSEISNNATTAGAGAAILYNLQLSEVTGQDSIISSLLQNAFGFVVRTENNSGTHNLRVENTTVTGATNGIAMGLFANGSSNVTANFQNDSIGHSSARGLQASTGTSSSAVLNLTVNNVGFRNNFVGVDLAHGSGGTYTFNVTNNRFQTNVASSAMAINVNRLGSPAFNSFGLFTGTISGNIIGTAGIANSGSDVGDGISVESNGSGGITRVAVVNNTIRQVGQHGIYVAAVDGNIGGTAPPLVEARVSGNSIANMEPVVALDGIHVLPGALNGDDVTVCLDIVNNNSTGIRNGLRVRPSGLPAANSTIQLEGWDGVTARSTYFTARPNTLAGGTSAYTEGTPSAPGGFVAVANCNTP